MKTKDVTNEHLNNFFLVEIEDENCFVKEGDEDGYAVEGGIEDALVFDEEEAEGVMANNPGRFKMVKVSDVIDKEEIEIHENK